MPEIKRSAIHIVLLVSLGLVTGVAGATSEPSRQPADAPIIWTPVDTPEAKLAFSRLESLSGLWAGTSTQGWTNKIEVRVIGRGSAVLVTSRFDDEPGEGMATIFHLDDDDLVLTHYCERGNQPHLRLDGIADNGRTLHFVFTGGGNLPSRDVGHMDELVMRLVSESEMRMRWTWHSDGVSRWLEDIEYRRGDRP